VVLGLLLWTRSYRFPRAYLICVLLQAALVFAAVYGAELASTVVASVADAAGRTATTTRTMEMVRILEAIQRYDSTLLASSRSLAWTLLAYALWLIPLLGFQGVRELFAVDAKALAPPEQLPLRAVADLPTATRRRFYEDAARTVQATTVGQPQLGGTVTFVVASALVGGLFVLLAMLSAVNQAGTILPAG
jgi:hypothetical protein